jgi:hypothetical protein
MVEHGIMREKEVACTSFLEAGSHTDEVAGGRLYRGEPGKAAENAERN